jgi:hypothetical protein
MVVGQVANRIQRGKHFASQRSPQSVLVSAWKESNTSTFASGQPAVVIQTPWFHGARSTVQNTEQKSGDHSYAR